MPNNNDIITHNTGFMIVNSYHITSRDYVPGKIILATSTKSKADIISDILVNRLLVFCGKNIFHVPSHQLFDLEDNIVCRVYMISYQC